jgi:hypothetical protein
LKQRGNRLAGTHRGEYLARELTGTIDGDSVSIRSSADETVIGNSLAFTFTGKVAGDTMAGDLDMGEYLGARWSARRYQYRQVGWRPPAKRLWFRTPCSGRYTTDKISDSR